MKNNMEKKTQVNQIYNDENALIRGVSYEKDEKFYPLRRGIEYGACSGVIYDKNFKEEQVMELTPVSVSTLTSVVVAECLNFDLFLLSRVLEIYDIEEGEQLQVFYTIKIMVYTMKGSVVEFQKKIMASKVKEFSWVTMATNAFAQIPQDKTEKLEFQRKVQQCIETEEAPTEILYPVAGWRKVPNIGWRFIFGDGIVGEKNKLVRTNSAYASMLVKRECVGSKQVFDMAMTMQRICDSGMCSTALFLYTHASMLATIFTEASHPLQFVFAISGVTNSRKTSLALEMAKVFSREKMITDAEFATATACGIEKVLGKYKDGVVIVDDFKPGVTVSQQKIMNEKLDAVVRFYGNRVSKKRMTDFMSDGEKKYFAIGGGCVITMEFVTGTTSSLSRMFLTELGKNDVDNEKLRFFQENRWILPTHIYDFLCFVTGDFENVVRYIKNRFVELRNRHQFVFGRYAEAYTVLMLVAEILVYYAKTRGFFTDSEVEENLKLVETILLAEFQRMEGRIRSLDKGTVIVDALKDGLFTHKLIPVILNDENSGQRCPCYQNDVIIFLQMKELQRIIFEYCKSYHLGDISMSSDELLMHLERMELLDIKESEGQKIRSRKLPVQHGNTLRYLYIKKENLQGFDV